MALMVTASPQSRFRPLPDSPPYESPLLEDLFPIAPPELSDPPDVVYLFVPLQIPNTSAKLSLQKFTQTFILMLACPTTVTKLNGGGAHLVSAGDSPSIYGRLFPVIYMSNFQDTDWSSLRSYLSLSFQLPHTVLQCEELVFDISTQLLNLDVCSTIFLMELVFFPYSPLVFSGCVAGSIVSKLTDTLLSGFRKSLAKWSLVTYALTAECLIVYSTLGVVSILEFRAFYMLYKSLGSISSFCITGVEDRGFLHDFSYLALMFALIFCMCVPRFVTAVCLAGLALLSSTLNNCSMDGA